MKYWIVPSSDNIFRIGDAIAANDGLVDWRESKFSVGDVVFIYKMKPECCVRYVMEVVKTNLESDDTFNQEPYWSDKDAYFQGMFTKYARLKLFKDYGDDAIKLDELQRRGIIAENVSTKELKNQDVIDFLMNPDKVEEESGVDFPEDESKYYEGALMKVNVNKYERNRSARQKCIEQKGLKCLVCGLDFNKTYGTIGKGFIHVHHLVPISSIGEEYKLDAVKDLVPVCPNCHYMLHRKNPPYSIEELQKIMRGELKLENIEDDRDVRYLIYNLLHMNDKIDDMELQKQVEAKFNERYPDMTHNDWRRIIADYTSMVRPEAKVVSMNRQDYGMAAEDSDMLK